MKYLILALITLSASCKPKVLDSDKRYSEFEFAVKGDEPMFEDEYMFEKRSSRCLIERVDEIEIYYFDWNDNGNFKEQGIDYIGVKSELDNKPTITKLGSTNSIRVNGLGYQFVIEDGLTTLTASADVMDTDLSLITEFTPMKLKDGRTLNPEMTSDSTVIYFWATWCAPCIRTLKSIDVEALRNDGIDLIPVAYNCSDSREFLEKNNLDFEDLIISEESAAVYNIKALAKQYTFGKDGEVLDANVVLKRYYR